jgi:hypothetical protein
MPQKRRYLSFLGVKQKRKLMISFLGSLFLMFFDYSYLGVTFSFNGKFNLAKKRLRDQASKAMYSVVILTYGSEVWGV